MDDDSVEKYSLFLKQINHILYRKNMIYVVFLFSVCKFFGFV